MNRDKARALLQTWLKEHCDTQEHIDALRVILADLDAPGSSHKAERRRRATTAHWLGIEDIGRDEPTPDMRKLIECLQEALNHAYIGYYEVDCGAPIAGEIVQEQYDRCAMEIDRAKDLVSKLFVDPTEN